MTDDFELRLRRVIRSDAERAVRPLDPVQLALEAGRRAEGDALAVDLAGEHLPAAVLRTDPHGHRHPDVVVVGRGREATADDVDE